LTSYDAFRVQRTSAPAGTVSVARGRGAVASVSREASALAIAVLEDGGNAFDAAFTLAFALAVYHPQAGNLGGGGYLLFSTPGSRTPTVLGFREQAPRGARAEHFLLPDGSPDPERTSFGPRSVCTPGTVKGFFALHAGRGRKPARDLLREVARRAEAGAPMTQYECECLNRLGPKLAASPEARAVYTKAEPFRAGDLLRNPALARTLERLAAEGEAAFYRGAIAEQLLTDLAANGGLVSAEDLAGYEVREVAPIGLELDGRHVWTPPPESGGAMLLEILSLLDRPEVRVHAWGSPGWHHLVAQASKLAFIERLDYLGDVPTAGNAVFEELLTRASAARLFGLIDPERDTPTETLAERVRAGRPGAAAKGGADTTHFAVVDAEGNAVSASYTMNLRYGSKWAVAGAGFLLNGSIDSFAFSLGRENYFGVIGSEPNLFAPGKRPASNMAPVMVTGPGGVEACLGTPGGPTIPTTLAQVLHAILVHGIEPARAIQAGRLHHQAWPDVLAHETGTVEPDLLAALAARGYSIKDKHELVCDVHAVFREGDEAVAVSDWRREGMARAMRSSTGERSLPT
jgi:gamma-glutamyltranspeptidase/glutathione hydrolase